MRAKQVQEWTIILLGRYSDSYANNQFRALQQFFKWHRACPTVVARWRRS